MKRIFFAIVIVLIGLTAFTADPPGTKVPIGLVVGAGKTKTAIDTTELKRIKDIDDKIDNSTLGSSLDEFYNKTQSNARFINEDGDTITGIINVPTATAGTNTTQAASTAFVNQAAVRKIYSSNVQVSHTGDALEYTAITFTIPAGTISANGSLHFISLFSFTSSTNAKTFRIKIGSNVIGYWNTSATGLAARQYHVISNRNSISSQISAGNGVSTGGGFSVSPMSAAVSTYSIDFSVNQTCTVTIQNANTGETSSIESFEVLAVY